MSLTHHVLAAYRLSLCLGGRAFSGVGGWVSGVRRALSISPIILLPVSSMPSAPADSSWLWLFPHQVRQQEQLWH